MIERPISVFEDPILHLKTQFTDQKTHICDWKTHDICIWRPNFAFEDPIYWI